MSKKILSIALAVVMLFSVLACTVGAANTNVTTVFPGEGQCGFRVVTDAYVGQPEGETVTVKVYWVHPVGTDFESYRQTWGNVVLAYTDAFNYDHADTKAGRVWGDAYQGIVSDGNVNANNANYSNSIINALSAAEKDYGWDSAMLIQNNVIAGNSYGYTANGGYPVDKDCEFFSLTFKTTREVTADDSFGLPSGKSAAAYSNGSKRVAYSSANTIISEGYCPANVVTVNETATAKMRPGTAEGTVDLGITGTVNGLSFEPNKTPFYYSNGDLAGHIAANLANVGVQARVNGVVSAAESTCIYETTTGFKYRAAITDIDAAGLGAYIEVRTYITDVNGNTYFSNWMNIDAADVHTAAVGNGMTGIA